MRNQDEPVKGCRPDDSIGGAKMPENVTSPTLGFLIYTYNKVDDARINMELVRSLWHQSQLFQNIIIVHAYNGDRSWYSTKYLEDKLINLHNSGHYQGAAELIDAGIKVFEEQYAYVNYVVVLASDTWLVNPCYVAEILKSMQDNRLRLATCAWNLDEEVSIFEVGMATDFFYNRFMLGNEAPNIPDRL